MVDAAVEASVIFTDFTEAKPHKLPDELKAFCERARAMGKLVRQHKSVLDFTPAEVDIIARNFIHCSAHWNAVTLRQTGELQGGTAASETIGFVNRPDENWTRTVYNMDGIKR